LGASDHVARKLGEYARSYRIMHGFLPMSGDPKGFGAGLEPLWQSLGINELGLMAQLLGRLHEAADIWSEHADDARCSILDSSITIVLQNTCGVALDLGRLGVALAVARKAVAEAQRVHGDIQRTSSLCCRATAQHQLGDIAAAREDFAAAVALQNKPMLDSLNGQWHAHHHLDLGNIAVSRAITEAGLAVAQDNAWNREFPVWHALFGRLALAEGQDPSRHIAEIRAWTAHTGDMQLILEAHHLAARAALARGDLPTARAEVDDGLRQARLCGYRLRPIELLVTLSTIDLAWPDAGRALAAAREALDLATAPDCQDAWGAADAAHAWGLAFEALGEREHAHRAFAQALAVREHIEHPQTDVTRAALARLG